MLFLQVPGTEASDRVGTLQVPRHGEGRAVESFLASPGYPAGSIRDILSRGGRPMSVRKTSVEINEELLAAVQRVLSTATLKDTIEQAFLEVLRAEARREEIEALATMRGMDLLDEDVMSGAWRS